MVNTANEKLEHIGGLAKSIVVKGGKEIQDDCNDYFWKNGKLLVGEALVTRAGRLPCKQLIHVASPKWTSLASHEKTREPGEESFEVRMLAQAVTNALHNAKRHNSIALPAIGAGDSGFPEDVCAETLIKSALEYCKDKPHSNLNEVHFVDMKDSVINAFHNEMKALFEKEPYFKDSTAKKEPTAKPRAVRKKLHKGKSTTDLASKSKTPIEDPIANLVKPGVTIDIMIIVGDLAKEEAEALVSTVSKDLDLSKNPCAKALSDAAGPGLQQECKAKGSLSVGEMHVTDGYNLNCKNVFHVSAGDWENGKGEEVLRSLIQCCLKEADKRQFFNVAFPAIGTGKAGFPRDFVARAFFEEVESFERTNPQSTVNEIRLVIFPKDKPTIKAFEEEQKKRIARTNIGRGQGQKENQNSERSVFNFGSVRLEVTSGDITTQTTDAIAIASNPKLNVTLAGKVGKTIAKNGGTSIQKECNKLGPQSTGSVVHTSAGSLPTKTIFHLVFDRHYLTSAEITSALLKCFVAADSLGVTSMAVPALGTGLGNMSAKDAANSILSAIETFSQENPTSVNFIRIVVFQSDLLKDFYSAIEESKADAPATVWQTIKGFFGMGDAKASALPPKDTSVTSSPAVDENMWLEIFASSDKVLNDAETRIKVLVKEKSRKEQIHNKAIGSLSESQVQRILHFETLHNTKIQIDKKIDRIVVRGDSEDVSRVLFAINHILSEKSKEEADRKFAELMSLNIEWSYVYDDAPEPYDIETNAAIEQAYKKKDPYVIVQLPEEDDDTATFRIDFSTMTETNLETRDVMQVVRKVKTAGIPLPPHWDPQPRDSDDKELDVHLVVLDPNGKEYGNVKQAIEKTSPIDIIKIERVQNPSRYRGYLVKKHELDDKNGSNEKKLFHGTNLATCELINLKGFNRSYCGKNATYYGQGVYFARDASYSMSKKYSPADSAGMRYMYLVSVLVGEYTQGSKETISPPPKDPTVPTVTYDSVVNDLTNPSIYVVFHDDQNYPDYLITFK